MDKLTLTHQFWTQFRIFLGKFWKEIVIISTHIEEKDPIRDFPWKVLGRNCNNIHSYRGKSSRLMQMFYLKDRDKKEGKS
jgi:hypothetical protein